MRKRNAAEIEEGKKARKKLSRKAKRRIAIFTVIGAVIIFIVVKGQIQANQPMMAETTEVLTGDLEQTLSTSGTVESEQVKTYYSPVGATIQDVPVELGDAVSAGQLLVAYDVNDLENAKEQAQYRTQAAVNSYLGSAAQNTQRGGKYAEASTNLDVLEQQIADQYENGWGGALELQDIDTACGDLICIRLWHDALEFYPACNLPTETEATQEITM